jgi:hypothetical protein
MVIWPERPNQRREAMRYLPHVYLREEMYHIHIMRNFGVTEDRVHLSFDKLLQHL